MFRTNNTESTSTLPQTIQIHIKDSEVIEKFAKLKMILLVEHRRNSTTKKRINKISNNLAGTLAIKKLFELYEEDKVDSKKESERILDNLRKQALKQKLLVGQISLNDQVRKVRNYNNKIRNREVQNGKK